MPVNSLSVYSFVDIYINYHNMAHHSHSRSRSKQNNIAETLHRTGNPNNSQCTVCNNKQRGNYEYTNEPLHTNMTGGDNDMAHSSRSGMARNADNLKGMVFGGR